MARRSRLLLLALGASLIAASAGATMTPEEKGVVEHGLDRLYRSDYDGAEAAFHEPLHQHPADPVYALGYAVAVWWRMENDFALPGSPEEAAFQDAIETAIDVAKTAEDRGEKADGALYLAASYGLRGRWRASRKHWFSAYLDGRRAVHEAQTAVKLDPQLYDAYLGLGAFDYYVATLSRFIRALAFIGGGDKAKGLSELRLAAEKGVFGRVAAKLLLVGIDWTFEKDPQEAWDILEQIHHEYPESPFVDSMRLLGLFKLHDIPKLHEAAREYLHKAETGAPYYQPIDKPVGRAFLGLSDQVAGEYDHALEDYRTALGELPSPHPWRSVLHLFIGETLDCQGHRDEAIGAYREALKDPPLWGVPRYAQFLLKHPYKPGDNPLPARSEPLE